MGTQPIAGCIGCNACLKNGKCFREDGVNEFVEKRRLQTDLSSDLRCIMHLLPV